MNRKLACFFLIVLTAATLSAAPVSFSTFLGDFEDPPTGSPGTGSATVIIDDVAHTMTIFTTFGGLIGSTTVSHIHVLNGPGDTDTTDTLGPVATTTPSFPGFPAGVPGGSYLNTFDMTDAGSYREAFITDAGGIPEAEAALFAAIRDGRAYLNIHTSQFGGGEIRGFFSPVPEPGTWGLMAASLAGLAFIRRRRAAR